jgi:hypothetical protein
MGLFFVLCWVWVSAPPPPPPVVSYSSTLTTFDLISSYKFLHDNPPPGPENLSPGFSGTGSPKMADQVSQYCGGGGRGGGGWGGLSDLCNWTRPMVPFCARRPFFTERLNGMSYFNTQDIDDEVLYQYVILYKPQELTHIERQCTENTSHDTVPWTN